MEKVMSTDQFNNSDQIVVADSKEEGRNRLSDEAFESLSFGNGAPADGKGTVNEKPLGLPELTFSGTEKPVEQEQLDTELGNAVKSGTVEDIQKVMKSIDTAQEYATLQQSVEKLNQNAPEGIEYELAQSSSGQPILTLSKSKPYPLDPSKKSGTTLEISANSANGVLLIPGVPHNGGRLWLPADAALARIQKQS